MAKFAVFLCLLYICHAIAFDITLSINNKGADNFFPKQSGTAKKSHAHAGKKSPKRGAKKSHAHGTQIPIIPPILEGLIPTSIGLPTPLPVLKLVSDLITPKNPEPSNSGLFGLPNLFSLPPPKPHKKGKKNRTRSAKGSHSHKNSSAFKVPIAPKVPSLGLSPNSGVGSIGSKVPSLSSSPVSSNLGGVTLSPIGATTPCDGSTGKDASFPSTEFTIPGVNSIAGLTTPSIGLSNLGLGGLPPAFNIPIGSPTSLPLPANLGVTPLSFTGATLPANGLVSSVSTPAGPTAVGLPTLSAGALTTPKAKAGVSPPASVNVTPIPNGSTTKGAFPSFGLTTPDLGIPTTGSPVPGLGASTQSTPTISLTTPSLSGLNSSLAPGVTPPSTLTQPGITTPAVSTPSIPAGSTPSGVTTPHIDLTTPSTPAGITAPSSISVTPPSISSLPLNGSLPNSTAPRSPVPGIGTPPSIPGFPVKSGPGISLSTPSLPTVPLTGSTPVPSGLSGAPVTENPASVPSLPVVSGSRSLPSGLGSSPPVAPPISGLPGASALPPAGILPAVPENGSLPSVPITGAASPTSPLSGNSTVPSGLPPGAPVSAKPTIPGSSTPVAPPVSGLSGAPTLSPNGTLPSVPGNGSVPSVPEFPAVSGPGNQLPGSPVSRVAPALPQTGTLYTVTLSPNGSLPAVPSNSSLPSVPGLPATTGAGSPLSSFPKSSPSLPTLPASPTSSISGSSPLTSVLGNLPSIPGSLPNSTGSNSIPSAPGMPPVSGLENPVSALPISLPSGHSPTIPGSNSLPVNGLPGVSGLGSPASTPGLPAPLTSEHTPGSLPSTPGSTSVPSVSVLPSPGGNPVSTIPTDLPGNLPSLPGSLPVTPGTVSLPSVSGQPTPGLGSPISSLPTALTSGHPPSIPGSLPDTPESGSLPSASGLQALPELAHQVSPTGLPTALTSNSLGSLPAPASGSTTSTLQSVPELASQGSPPGLPTAFTSGNPLGSLSPSPGSSSLPSGSDLQAVSGLANQASPGVPATPISDHIPTASDLTNGLGQLGPVPTASRQDRAGVLPSVGTSATKNSEPESLGSSNLSGGSSVPGIGDLASTGMSSLNEAATGAQNLASNIVGGSVASLPSMNNNFAGQGLSHTFGGFGSPFG